MDALAELGVKVMILARPVEVVEAIPIAQEQVHHSYDARSIRRFWEALINTHRVLAIRTHRPVAVSLAPGSPAAA
jgi:hypothetical protein